MEKNKNSRNGQIVPINETEVKTPAQVKEILEAQLNKYQRLNKLVNDRDLFIAKKIQLNDYLAAIDKESRTDDLETNVCKVVFKDSRSYRDDNALSISNLFIIKKFIQFLNTEIDIKVEELEKQIIL